MDSTIAIMVSVIGSVLMVSGWHVGKQTRAFCRSPRKTATVARVELRKNVSRKRRSVTYRPIFTLPECPSSWVLEQIAA